MKKRKLELVVLSDIHFGTYGCHAEKLLIYLNSIAPKKLILNGDIIDIWQFKKRYFPSAHLKVIKKIIGMASKGAEVFYITGNHDEMLRKFSGNNMGSLKIVDKLLLVLNGKKTWIFHGDVFDISIQNAKWIAKLGGYGYDLLILLNRMLNWTLLRMDKEKYSLSKKIKNSVKGAISYIHNFEKVATDLAIENDFDCVICGHIHQPKKEWYTNNKGKVLYLNSGDWVENLTSLEYGFKRWKLYQYNHEKLAPFYSDEELKEMNLEELIYDISKKEELIRELKVISDQDELVHE